MITVTHEKRAVQLRRFVTLLTIDWLLVSVVAVFSQTIGVNFDHSPVLVQAGCGFGCWGLANLLSRPLLVP